MESIVGQAGWSGMEAPRTVERKRKGRGGEVLPTPPRAHLPTPESIRRTAKPQSRSHVIKPTHASSETTATQLPTPQTLARHSRKKSITHAYYPEHQADDAQGASADEGDGDEEMPSPIGQTTFFHSSATASKDRENAALAFRRRPGLTFAQQMGLLPGTATGRRGVGIGGNKSGTHKVDQIRFDTTNKSNIAEENPFLASPGPFTLHRPAQLGDVQMVSPPTHSKPKLQSPAKLASGSLLTPPPSHLTQRIASPPPLPVSPTQQARKASAQRKASEASRRANLEAEKARLAEEERKEKIRRMRDEDDNPFLVKRGESSSTAMGRHEVVDEDRPTVTYVFRGAKKVFANPFIGSETRIWESEIDVDDEEYEPHPCPPPKLLWPTAPPQATTPKSQSRKAPSAAAAEMEDPNKTPTRSTRAQGKSKTPMTRGISPPSSPIPTPHGEYEIEMEEEDEDTVNGPKHVFTSDEEFVPTGELVEEEEESSKIPVRRGLLFGQGSSGGQGAGKRSIGSGKRSSIGQESLGKKRAKRLR